MKRRGDELLKSDDDAGEMKENGKKTEKTFSVKMYMITMFIFVVLIILLSYFVQQRDHSKMITTLTEQHSEFSVQALENIEDLQQKTLQLTEENRELSDRAAENEERISELENELSETKDAWAQDVKDVTDALKAEINRLELENEAKSRLIDMEIALKSRDKEAAQAAAELIEPVKDLLSEEYLEEYNELLKKLGLGE
jgi:predicted RNase H-like nuclease (RuvC/YqgF family)